MLGLYIHVPFCRQKCLYCDFCSFPKIEEKVIEQYVSTLCRDLTEKAAETVTVKVDTVFFGGGTPTCLSSEQLVRILNCIRENYDLTENAEITLECNPATVNSDGLEKLFQAGFNRLSMGLQSIHENELKALGRIHSYADFLSTYQAARKAGFRNLSADLMFGIPEQTPESYRKTLEEVSKLGLTHLSCYSLILEPGTPLEAKKDLLALPCEEEVRQMYLEGISLLKSKGYLQYEISNFAKKGLESRHNLRYWNQEPYLGFGVSAYSDFAGVRYGYGRDLSSYLAGNRETVDVERLNLHERMNEYVMLRMRLCAGLSLSLFREKFGEDGELLFGKKMEKYVPMGLIEKRSDSYAFTPEGMLVSNSILSEILDFDKT